MNKKHKILFLLLLFLICLPAVAAERIDFENPSYLFHLYYDNGRLLADRDFEFNYDVIPEEFVSETYNTRTPFKGEVVNLKNEIVSEFYFDPKRGDSEFVEGKIKIRAPYIPDGQKVTFFNSEGDQLLVIVVSESSFCNDDGVCNRDRGEDENTCPNDCVVGSIPPVSEEGLLGTMLVILIVSAAVLVGAGGWYTWRRWKKAKDIQEGQFTNEVG